MTLITIDLPDELAERVRAAELDVSAIAQAALTAELDRQANSISVSEWLAGLPLGESTVSHEDAMRALDEAKAEMYGDDASIYDKYE